MLHNFTLELIYSMFTSLTIHTFLFFTPLPDIKRFNIASFDSSFFGVVIFICFIVGVALAFASFFIIKSPDFSDIFLPSRSPVCDIPDSNAFFLLQA